MDCSKVATGSSFGVLDPVKKIKASVKRDDKSDATKQHNFSIVETKVEDQKKMAHRYREKWTGNDVENNFSELRQTN